MHSYKEHIVAFMDILGFKNIINTEDFENIRQMFLEIIPKENEELALIRAADPADPKDAPLIKYNKILQEDRKIHIMSDSIVVAAPCQLPQALAVVIDTCMMVQQKLFELEKPIFLRGAVAKGDFYSNGSIIFGKALVDAYIAQEYYAEYPRIIVSDDVQNGMDMSLIREGHLCKDEDGYWYINALEDYINYPYWNGTENNPTYTKLRTYIDRQLSGYTDRGIRNKYLWLDKQLKYIEYRASCF